MSINKINKKLLLICIAIPLLVGTLSGFISKDSMGTFSMLNQPPISPPGWIFPVIWTILYMMMGIASYLILTSRASHTDTRKAIKLYSWQLLLNFFWTFWFFNLQLYFFSFFWLVTLWIFILATILSFSRISKPAAYLMIPYLIWVTFAGYLNLGIALLN